MPRARIAYARNLPKRFRVKSETRSVASAGSALRPGSTTTSRAAAPHSGQLSRVGIASLGGEEAGRPALDEYDDEDQDQHLAEHGAERRLDDLVQTADPGGGEDAPEELAHAPGHDHHERVDDVVLAELR